VINVKSSEVSRIVIVDINSGNAFQWDVGL